ncbi:SDR family oxidoreductase [Rhodococcus sp. NPDC059968]|uniref:SDR family oxidoreductase n=1 Tax=Rhodococcus sp. NPDC059968 TaxID=3347017 RepID=UPI00366A8D1A
MDFGLSGKAFVITGGSEGLGFASARELLREGAVVTVSSRSQSKVTEAVTRLAVDGPDAVHGVAADNGDPTSANRVVASALSQWGRLDGLVVSVGGPPPSTALGATDDDWERSFHSVFLGAIRLVRAAVPAMTEGGAIVLVLSTSVKSPLTGLGISNGLRPGLAMVAKDIADELAPSGIRVVSMLPGLFNTARGAGATSQELDNIPLRRSGDPAEFGRAVAFLASPAASYITGSTVAVDGGALRVL